MTEEKKSQEQNWDEVGEQFEAMGKSLSAAIDETTQDEEVQQEFKQDLAELKATAAQVSQKVKDAKDSGESPDLDDEAQKLSELSGALGKQAQAAGQGVAGAAQPHLSGALRSVQAGLNQIVDELKTKG